MPPKAPEKSGAFYFLIYIDIYFNMNILAFLVLLSAIAISACGAYFSIVGLKMLFVGGGISIVVMGTALEVGKVITATFLKQKWNEIGFLLKAYLIAATIFLMGITSIGIYGYLSAGYTATNITVKGFEGQIEANNAKIVDLEKEIEIIKKSDYNADEIKSVEENRKKTIEQKLQLVSQRNQRIESIRKSSNTNQDASVDIAAAKQALEISKSSTDNDISRELEQIKLYNARLEILDKEVQKWMEEGTGGLFKKNGLDKAREVKTGQEKERNDIDVQIKASQDRISKLREQYTSQVKAYNDRVSEIENRNKSQRGEIETSIKNIEKEISEIEASIVSYNKESDDKISNLNKTKDILADQGKKKIYDHLENIKNLKTQNTEIQEKIVHTDVGTFKFIAASLGIPLEKAVNYFIWSIMAVFDPLAVCLILAFNSLVAENKEKKKKQESDVLPMPTPTPTPTSTPTPTPTLLLETQLIATPIPILESTQTPTPFPSEIRVQPETSSTETPTGISIEAQPSLEVAHEEINVDTPLPPPPPAPHAISSGKIRAT